MTIHQFRQHPLKGLYLIFELAATLFFRLPSWVLVNLPQASRPRPSWSLIKSVLVKVMCHLVLVQERTDSLVFYGDHATADEGPDIMSIWVEPTPQLINAEIRNLADAANVEPVTIPGYWIDNADMNTGIGAPPRPGEKVIYALHGGGFVRFSASPRDLPAIIARALLEHCADVSRVFALEYRLSKHEPDEPANPFPAALLDTLAGYVYLTNVVGFAPEDIVVEGDSAGGNLALALVRYLVENDGVVPGLPKPPGALLLLSPWADPSDTAVPPGSRANENMASDFIGMPEGPFAKYTRRAFLGPLANVPDGRFNRYVAPGCSDARMPHVSFEGFPRTMIVAGEAEMLVDQINRLVRLMKRDMGEKVCYHEGRDAIHDFIMLPFCEPERTLALEAISEWLQVT
ncbi:alpha/beta-hydrolase [Lactarius indigo]|nr:alpha/beta-hydrolase [Lactarius indigo]